MSGEKISYVRIPQREERRLREMEKHFRAVQSDLPERLRTLQREMEAQTERQRARMDERFNGLKQTTDKLKSDMARAERLNQQRLRETFEKAQREYTNLVSQERAERLQQAAAMRREYQSLIEDERIERQQQISELQSRVGSIEARENALQEMAESWLGDLRLLQEEVEKLPHQRFAPGRMNRIKALIEQGASNLKYGASEAALVNAQNCYLDLIELRAEVISREQAFEYAYQKAWQEVKTLIEEINVHRNIMLEQHSEKDAEFEVDFWSRGRFSEIKERVNELERRLENEKENLTIEQVQAIEGEVDTLRGEMLAAVEKAKIAIINSQTCYEVSDIVEETLKEQGFEITDAVYEGEDQRGAYAMKMQNLGGDEVVTIITPSNEREMEYTLQMNFFDRKQDENVRLSFARAVNERLNQAGLSVSFPEKTREVSEPNRETLDFERFSQTHPASVAQKQFVERKSVETERQIVEEHVPVIEKNIH